MKKATILIGLVISIILLVYFVFLRDFDENRLKRNGNLLVEKIEEYSALHGKLPNTLNEVDLSNIDSEELFYEKRDSVYYTVWFGTSLGESLIYYSDSKEWENGYRTIDQD
ncbi:hypothetical protein [Marivirga arenosa]|uniref:Uncharacterized protein n=1 Tax=Marivirga arenosa TaxID=3059076 RepID=A0AA51X3V8_9BACT|nr:hypothetical protein [Marivirga sp. BKB1-2]WKK80380.2 hypothetical protein QYS47_25010 [Marivirga sp. BKB1-2]WKK80393.2 hypothetical protein QYS47_25080 [Marivirga sp. BKB1-2]WNB17012.1 hypothetical protein QYS47_32590 [Marivirga sp. BKB1-2]WNB17017.1 hypothetical protein QYS47_32615 [Marivirga sp. BKB1-2]